MSVKKSLVKKALGAQKKVVNKIVEEKIDVMKEAVAKKYELSVNLKDLLDAGCHLGHKISKTNPKSKENIYKAMDGIQIVDLTKTIIKLSDACNYVYSAVKSGKTVAFLGTKRQAREVVRRVATELSIPFVTDRWLGGTVSNWGEIKKNIKRLNDINAGMKSNKYATMSKKDLSLLKKEIGRLNKMIGGLVTLEKLFDVIFVVDSGYEKSAIKECSDKGIKVVSIVDTDSNPEKVDFAIPANDDNVKSISLIVEEMGKAVKAGMNK
ncbi:MAG: 30S ribosomal protein S2 [Candidatus Shapirobacteria bacterium]